MKKFLTIALSVLTATTAISIAAEPTAEQIMTSVRQVAALQQKQALTGVIRKGSKKIPLNLFLEGDNIQFMIDQGREGFHLRLKDNDQELWDITNGKATPFPPSKISKPIARTDVSYEDLALKFLYWKNPRIIGSQRIGLEDCWRVHLMNPDQNGLYREVSVWVTKKHRALARVIGYGPKPDRRPMKQFEITKLMTVKGVTTVEAMKVTRFDKNRRAAGITYLEFNHMQLR